MKTMYFAYGLDLEEHTMVDVCPSARFYSFAVLKDHRLKFASSEQLTGVASFTPASFKHYVEGILYEINHSDFIKEEWREGFETKVIKVMTHDGRDLYAVTLFTDPTKSVLPAQSYLLRLHKKYGDYGFQMRFLEEALMEHSRAPSS